MDKIFLCLLCLGLLAAVQAVPGASCTQDCQCDCGECCQILNPNPVVSKRQEAAKILPIITKAGTCQPYKAAGEYCSPFALHNGYCGCAPGLTCRLHKLTVFQSASQDISSAVERKRKLAGPYKCE